MRAPFSLASLFLGTALVTAFGRPALAGNGTTAGAGGEAAATEQGVSLGARLGFGLPFGNTDNDGGDVTMSDFVTSMIPIWLDIGYRFNPSFYIGVFGHYGFSFLNTDKIFKGCDATGASCSGSDLLLGVNLQYNITRGPSAQPWIGLGVAYESMNFSASGGGGEASVRVSGFDFLNVQFGVDAKVSPQAAIGPFISLSAGQYSSVSGSSASGQTVSADPQNKALHAWVVIGLRGVLNTAVNGTP